METIKTQEEIQEQIDGLLIKRNKLPEYSILDYPNWLLVDLQIRVLKGELSSLEYWDNNSLDYWVDERLVDGMVDLYNELVRVEKWLRGEIIDNLFKIKTCI